MSAKRIFSFDYSLYPPRLLLLVFALLPMWLACSYTAEEETIYLTPWLKQRKEAKVSPMPMGNAYIQVSHAVKKTKKIGFFSYTAWDDLNYDIVSVIDDQHVLASRSRDYAVSLLGRQLTDDDLTVKLITASDFKGSVICSGWERVRSSGQFIDCEDSSNNKEFVVRRMTMQGKELSEFRMEVKRSTDWHTVAEILFYDDEQQIYVLEMGNANKCRLNLIGPAQVQVYEAQRNGQSYACRDAPFWQDKVAVRFREPLLFGEIGQNRTISNRYLNPKFR